MKTIMTTMKRTPIALFLSCLLILRGFNAPLVAYAPPPPDCSAELAAYQAADAAATAANEALAQATQRYEDAQTAETVAEVWVDAAQVAHDAMSTAYLIALATGDPLAIAAAALALVAAAAALDAAVYAADVAHAETMAALDAQLAAYNAAIEAEGAAISAAIALMNCLNQ